MNTSKKLKCNVLGNWSYCNEDRYQKLIAKYGSEEALQAEYQSRAGQKLVAECGGDIEKARKKAQKVDMSDKIACTITGELLVISKARMAKKMETLGLDEKSVRKAYISRVAKRLLAQGKTAEEIKAMYDAGEMPAPSAPKGSRTEVPKAPKASKAPKSKKKTEVKDTVPTQGELDPLRQIDGEDAKARRNRIRKERRAMAKS